MALAALAIRGHKSAHSFPIGPVIADPVKGEKGYRRKFYLLFSNADKLRMHGSVKAILQINFYLLQVEFGFNV